VNVVIAAGGTGGHVFPALSLADVLVRDHGAHVRFIGSPDGQEATHIPAAGYRFDAVKAAPFVREVSMRAAKAPVIAVRSVFECASLVRGADVAVGTGGYVSVAPMLAARRAHLPIVLHEPNAIPGLANRVRARSATSVAIAFEDARSRIPGGARIEMIGYPVRTTILDVPTHRAALAEEFSGIVEELGERATRNGLKVGDRVAGNFLRFCGTCRPCQDGRQQFCENIQDYNRPGMSETVVWHESQVYRLPDSVSLLE